MRVKLIIEVEAPKNVSEQEVADILGAIVNIGMAGIMDRDDLIVNIDDLIITAPVAA